MNALQLGWIGLAAALLASVAASPARAQDAPRKKLIEYGWDVPYPDFVRDHIREMEKRPFDGIIFRLKDENHAFDPRPWDPAKLRPQFDQLRAIRWGTFTDNFLTLYAANNWNMDWFNDEQWRNIVANLKLTAKAARIGRCVGICFDPEPYGPNPWVYKDRFPGKSYAEVVAQVRKRGAEFMAALRSELPNVRLLTFFHLSLFRDVAREPDPKRREERLSGSGWPADWGLLAALVNGWLDASTPKVRIIDGNEMSYYYTSSEEFYRDYHLMKQGVLSLVAPENRSRYREVVQAGMALYLDRLLALRDKKDDALAYGLDPEDRLRWLKFNTYMALHTTDEYVWCYSERMNWWENKVPEGCEETIRAAREMIAQGKPLDVDLRTVMEKVKR